MIYQFECDEIKECHECPMYNIECDLCELQQKSVFYDSTPQLKDCPLAAIPQTETTRVVSDGFSYDAKPKQFQCLGCRDYFYMPQVPAYCPNCGRRIGREQSGGSNL